MGFAPVGNLCIMPLGGTIRTRQETMLGFVALSI